MHSRKVSKRLDLVQSLHKSANVMGEAAQAVHLAHDCALRLSFAIEFGASDAGIQAAGRAFDEKATVASAALASHTATAQVLFGDSFAVELQNLREIFESLRGETVELFQRRAKLNEQEINLALEQLRLRWRVEIDNALDLCIKAARSVQP